MIFKSYAHEQKTPLNGISLNLETSLEILKRTQANLEMGNFDQNYIKKQLSYIKS